MHEKKKIYIGVNEPFILNDHKSFWMVVDGEVDLYYVNISKEGTYQSQLNYLYTAKKGELLFSLLNQQIEEGFRIIAMTSRAKLLELDKNNLMEIDHTFLKFHFNKWINKLSARIYQESIPRIYKVLEQSPETVLKEGELTFPTKDLLWCSILEGEVAKYGGTVSQNANAEYSYPFPVNRNLWLKSLSKDTKIKVLNPYEVIKDDIFFMLSLEDIQKEFYQKILKNESEKLENQRKRISAKVGLEDDKIENTIAGLSDVVKNGFSKGNDANSTFSKYENELLTACQFIGNQVGFNFKTPKYIDSYEGSLHKQLYAIGQASNVRVRKIILRGTWWKDENGHMLAFSKEDKKPVALLQKTSNSYTFKTADGNEVEVTPDIAESLEPISFMFFFAFDGKMNAVKKIWDFAIQGVQKDAKFLILAAFSGSLLGLLVPILSGIMFDDVIPTADREMLFEVFGLMLAIGLVTALLRLIQGVLQLRVETKSNVNLQGGLMNHLLRLPVSFYKKYTAGDLTNRALSINAIRQILSNTVMTAVLSGAFSIVNLGLLFYYESSLAWIGVGLALLAVLFVAGIGWLKLKYDREISDDQGDIQGFLFEFLSGITKIRITGAETRIFSLWADKFSKLKRLAFKSGSYQNFIEVFNGSYPLLTKVFFFSFIYYSFTNAATTGNTLISVGAFMAFLSAFNQFLNDTLRMSMSLISSLNIVTLYERVQPIIEEEPESQVESIDPGELSGGIELSSVSFRYDEEQPLVLNNISLEIKPGEMVAFIGPSGSGKSTIMRILLGFEEPESGSVYYQRFGTPTNRCCLAKWGFNVW